MTAPSLKAYAQGQSEVSADNLNTFEQTCNTFANLRAFVGTVGQQVYCRGASTAGDTGQGAFRWSPNATAPDNNDDIIAPTGAATGRWIKQYATSSFAFPTIWDFGAVGDGVTDDSAAFAAASVVDETIYVPDGTYKLDTAVDNQIAAFMLSPKVVIDPWSNIDLGVGPLTDTGNGSNIWRLPDRIFLGDASSSQGSSDSADPCSYIGDPTGINSFYLERGAAICSPNAYGGIGGTFASRASDRYTYMDAVVWEALTAFSVGERCGYQGRVYKCIVAGTTSSTPPSVTSGTEVDGTVTWQWVDHTYMTPIGLAGVALSDIADGSGVWASYTELVRTSTGGTGYAREIAVKNKGSDVTNNPYSRFPGGATIGDWFAGGGDAVLGPPTNPSTCAILIGRGATTWNKGIVFEDQGLTDIGGGIQIALAMARKQAIEWFVGGSFAAAIYSDVSTGTSATQMVFKDDQIWFLARGVFIGTITNGVAGTPANYLDLAAFGAGNPPTLRALGTDTNIDLKLLPKGTGVVRYGTHSALGAEILSGFITINDSGGTPRKLAVIS